MWIKNLTAVEFYIVSSFEKQHSGLFITQSYPMASENVHISHRCHLDCFYDRFMVIFHP